MGRPVRVPYLRIMATEEGQTGNVYDTIHFNLTDEASPLSQIPGVDPGLTKINLPDGGEITPSTASSSSKDGGKETWVCFDETHLYNTPELRRMYATVTRNLRKRKKGAGTWYLETTTMFAPGQDSVAERTYEEAEAIREGKKQRGRARLLYDHRYGVCKNLKDEDELRAALLDSYGDAMEWMDLETLVDDFYDLRNDSADGKRYFLNSRTSSSDSWMESDAWEVCRRPEELSPNDLVTLGFDGSIRDDATALTACRVVDGHLQLLGVWEKPEGHEGEGWQVDREAVDAAVARAFDRYEVVGFYCDPPHWQDYVDKWTSDHGEGLQLSATQARPLEWWTNRPTAMEHALDFHGTYYELTGSPALPKPAQAKVPVLIGGNGATRTPRLAARFADEFNMPFGTVEDSERQFGRVRAAAEEIGRDADAITLSNALVVCVGKDDQELARRAAAIGREVDELRANGLAGSPAEVVDRIGRFAEAGSRRMYLQVLDLHDLDHLELISAQVQSQLP
ncbi:hypothetical protein QFZ66_002392 [Streptomyces sp. B4I13]|nr:hypothetical protein [Streptomyces sp. B4I13]